MGREHGHHHHHGGATSTRKLACVLGLTAGCTVI